MGGFEGEYLYDLVRQRAQLTDRPGDPTHFDQQLSRAPELLGRQRLGGAAAPWTRRAFRWPDLVDPDAHSNR